jgi:hypothetical protein
MMSFEHKALLMEGGFSPRSASSRGKNAKKVTA